MNILNIIFNKYKQFIKFSLIGVSNLLITLFSYYILIFFNVNYQISNILSFFIGSLNGYYWNKKWVFKNKNKNKIIILKFYLSYFSTWVLSAIFLYLWVEKVKISKELAPILNIFITTPINYILNKKWTFGEKKKRGIK